MNQLNEEVEPNSGRTEIERQERPEWRIVKARTILHIKSGDAHVCEVSLRPSIRGPERPAIEAEAWANARLIAASPTMFDYLKRKASEGDSDAVRIIASI